MNIEHPLVLRMAHVSEAGTLAMISRLQVEYGLHWRWTAARIRCAIRDRETTVLVASIGGDIAGFAIMKFRDEDAHLLLLAVQPQSRRSGIGRSMLEWLEASCRTAGIRHVRLEVRAGNRPARAFYDRLGYLLVGQVAGYYEGRESAAVMVKPMFATG